MLQKRYSSSPTIWLPTPLQLSQHVFSCFSKALSLHVTLPVSQCSKHAYPPSHPSSRPEMPPPHARAPPCLFTCVLMSLTSAASVGSRSAKKTKAKIHQCLADDYLLQHSTETLTEIPSTETPAGDRQSVLSPCSNHRLGSFDSAHHANRKNHSERSQRFDGQQKLTEGCGITLLLVSLEEPALRRFRRAHESLFQNHCSKYGRADLELSFHDGFMMQSSWPWKSA